MLAKEDRISDQSWHGWSNPMQVSVVTYQGVIGLDREKKISELVNWLSNLSCLDSQM